MRYLISLIILTFLVFSNYAEAHLTVDSRSLLIDGDVNGDGELNILVLGTTRSINDGEAFSPIVIAQELESILTSDPSISLTVNVVAEDIYRSRPVIIGLGGGGTEYTYEHKSHSLTQYYYWPEGQEDRINNLKSAGSMVWDYVVIGADPFIVATTPGFYSLGVNKIADKVVEGGAIPLLMMMWPKAEIFGASVDHFEEFTYRTSKGSRVAMETLPAGLAWATLPADKQDVSSNHPSPNGAYLCAATIYAHIYDKSAALSDYQYDDVLADVALDQVIEAGNMVHFSGKRTFTSPFKGCGVVDSVINYNHTGTSSERGILNGLNWIFNKATESLQNGGGSPIEFNYGRANSNFEANKRYKIDPSKFDFSFGFPMQDHGNHGNTSLLYGIDRRESGTINDTDLGVARFMVRQSELPYGRAVPVRTLYAQMKEAIPGQSAYRDSWHMHRDLDKAIAAFMYTVLTGNCVLEDEPADPNSAEWNTWMSHKIGYETAWNLMYLQGRALGCERLNVDVAAEPMVGGVVFGSGTFGFGDTVRVSATANSGYHFVNWTIGGTVVSTDTSYAFCIDQNLDLVANFDIVSGNSDYEESPFNIYPNPAQGFINIVGLKGEAQIYNQQGRLVWKGDVSESDIIDISSFNTGVYSILIKSLNKTFIVTK